MSGINVLWIAKYKQNWHGGPHQHDFYQLVYPMSGDGYITDNNVKRKIVNNLEVMLARPGMHHALDMSYDPSEEFPTAFDCKFTIEDPDIKSALENFPQIITIENTKLFTKLIASTINEARKKNRLYQQAIDANITSMLVTLIRQFEVNTIRTQAEADDDVFFVPDSENFIKGINTNKLVEYIDTNISEIINLDDLSKFANVNKTTLIYIFKQLFGMTPMRYVNYRRMMKAKNLLLSSGMSISEISNVVGFQSIHYFSKSFKEREGVSPMEFRMTKKDDCYLLFSNELTLNQSKEET